MKNLVFLLVLAFFALNTTDLSAESASASMLSFPCYGCHGPRGISAGKSVPSIAGMNSTYLLRIMLEYKREERKSTIMGRLAKGYRIAELGKISDYFSKKEWGSAEVTINQEKMERAQKLNKPCEECHEDSGRFQDKEVPRIAGQWPKYLYSQLLDYSRGDARMPQPPKMKEQLETLSESELLELSEFYGSRK